MQATPTSSHPAPHAPPVPSHSRGRTRLAGLFALLLLLVSIAVLPPLINVSRFQQRIARNISAALGRPVYFDNVTLMLFPQPGFTLNNFVLDEDPAFGYEPILRADQVQVTLRLTSLFRPHTEFSKISFSDPSVNLVYAHGRWNIESLLLQAANTEAAPTAQRFAGPARRFPYIEATGARLNLKFDQQKSPVSFTDADFALWLPSTHQWHLRLEARPTRTDSAPGDTGSLRAEGTLGPASSSSPTPISLADVPIDLHGDWRDAQLGGLSGLLLGRDPGLRGDLSLAFTLRGTVGSNAIAANLKLANARRAEFVPDHPLSLEASCQATSADTFRAFPTIDCHWPPAGSSDPALIALTASLPDARNLDTASATLTLPALPADTFFNWLSIATPNPPAVLPGTGTLTGSLIWGTTPQSETGRDFNPLTNGPKSRRTSQIAVKPICEIAPDSSSGVPSSKSMRALAPGTCPTAPPSPTLTGEIQFTGGSLVLDSATNRTLALGDVVLRSTPPAAPPSPRSRRSLASTRALAETPGISFTLQPLPLDLGGKQPATLTALFNANGYTLHLTGSALPATLRQLAKAVPQLGDNLPPLLDQLSPPPTQLPVQSPNQSATPTPTQSRTQTQTSAQPPTQTATQSRAQPQTSAQPPIQSRAQTQTSAQPPTQTATPTPTQSRTQTQTSAQPPTQTATQAQPPTPSPLGNPRLQPWASQDTQNTGASAPGASLPSAPISIDLTATRPWDGPQTWTNTAH